MGLKIKTGEGRTLKEGTLGNKGCWLNMKQTDWLSRQVCFQSKHWE